VRFQFQHNLIFLRIIRSWSKIKSSCRYVLVYCEALNSRLSQRQLGFLLNLAKLYLHISDFHIYSVTQKNWPMAATHNTMTVSKQSYTSSKYFKWENFAVTTLSSYWITICASARKIGWPIWAPMDKSQGLQRTNYTVR